MSIIGLLIDIFNSFNGHGLILRLKNIHEVTIYIIIISYHRFIALWC
jgi:hypothetical protein